ncbi:uncharacterized protein LOC136758197 [Amia ocellicauda]|uniref:uncharacterized protein LOC136758197 n=1 Tax=Amia ocellicauda TaxID=2972642 RepID=UPI003463B059
MHINEHGALSIENVSRADGGVYHCTAENRAGREQRTATLTVTVENIQPKDENQDPEKVSRDRNTTNTPTEDPADIRSQNPVVKSATKAKLLGPVRELHGNTAWDHLELSWQPPFMDHGAPGAYKISYSTVQTIPTPAVSALSAEVEEKGMLEPDKKRPRGRNTQLLDHSSPGPTVFSITKQNGVLRTTDTRVTIWGLLPNQTYLISVLPYTAEGQEGVPLEKMLKTGMQHWEEKTLKQTVPLGRLPSATEVSFHTSQKTHPPSLTSPSSEIPNSSVGSVLLSKLASSSQTVSLKSHEFAFSTPFTVPFPTSQPTTSPEVIAPSSVENFTSEDTSPRDSIAGSRELEARPSLTVSHTDPYLPLTVRVTTAPSETTELSPSQAAKSSKTGKAELTEWPKENTSQSPMRTSDNDMARDPKQTSWVPVLEKHDIPIVVGVGISLTLIFITMGFYSLVQKNEAGEAETGRGLLRDSGASSRNSSKPETGRTYENRAFEDDNSVAVIEQSPYTSASRSSQPATNTITVMAELSPEGQQEDLETILEINTESEQSVLLQSVS